MRLSVRQRDILLFIKDTVEQTGFAPLADDIAIKFETCRGAIVSSVTMLLLKKCLGWGGRGRGSYVNLRLTETGLAALSLPPKSDAQSRLEAILAAWDTPTGPGWADALEKAINDGRDEPDQSSEACQVVERIEQQELEVTAEAH